MSSEVSLTQVKESLSKATTVGDMGKGLALAVDLLSQRAGEAMALSKQLHEAGLESVKCAVKELRESLDEVWRLLIGEGEFDLSERKEIADAFKDVHSSVASAVSTLAPKGYGFTNSFDTKRGLLLVKVTKLKGPTA